jgi:peptide/nickel transport system substrate-binding protein
MKTKMVYSVLSLLIVVILVFGACSSQTPTTATTASTITSTGPKIGGTVNMLLTASPGGPGGLPWELLAGDQTVLYPIYEPLMRGSPSGQPVPWLAESFKLADDQSSITFTLKKGIKFTDGSELNAEVAQWNLRKSIETKQIAGATTVDIVDPYTVRMNFSKWSNILIGGSFCDSRATWMASYEAYKKNGEDWLRENPVGTGPFKFKSFQRDASYDVVRNDNYWIKGMPYLDSIRVSFVSDAMTQQSLMISGTSQIMQMENPKQIYDLRNVGTFEGGIFATACFVPDTGVKGSPFYNNPKAREAVEHAINRQAIADAFGYGLWTSPNQVPAPAMKGIYDPNFTGTRNYDVAKAKQALADAGMANGFPVTIIVGTLQIDRNILTAIQQDLAKVGITSDIQFLDSGQYMELNMKGWKTPGILVLEPIGMVGGSLNFVLSLMFNVNTPFNNFWAKSPAFLEAINKSLSSPFVERALEKGITDVLYAEASVIPVCSAGQGFVIANKVKDFIYEPRSFPTYWTPERAWLEK